MSNKNIISFPKISLHHINMADSFEAVRLQLSNSCHSSLYHLLEISLFCIEIDIGKEEH